MGIFALIFLPLRFFSIFARFTFTDAEDFLPMASLIIGLIGTIFIYRSVREKVSAALMFLMLLLSAWPILPNIGLYFMAREFQAANNSWPQVMVDDPKNQYGHTTPLFDALFHVVNYLEAFSGAWMVVFFALFFAMRTRFSLIQQRVVIGLMVFSLLLVLLDPGNLYAWWMD